MIPPQRGSAIMVQMSGCGGSIESFPDGIVLVSWCGEFDGPSPGKPRVLSNYDSELVSQSLRSI